MEEHGERIKRDGGKSNLVGEDCFHSVLKLKRSEDRRPRFESRLSAGDNQTEGDLFSLVLRPDQPPPPPSVHLAFILKRRNREREKRRERAETENLRFVQVAT